MPKSIADQLRDLANQLDGIVVSHTTEEVREGFVKVTPTGVRATGASRWYPDPQVLMPGSTNCWSYAQRLTQLKDKNGEPYCTQTAAIMFMNMTPPELVPIIMAGRFAEAVDRMQHPQEWWNQEEEDRQVAMHAATIDSVWVPTPTQG